MWLFPAEIKRRKPMTCIRCQHHTCKRFGYFGKRRIQRWRSYPRFSLERLILGEISTSYVERQNLTMRMQMRRFTRLTNAFSKKLENLKAALALHFAHYNFA